MTHELLRYTSLHESEDDSAYALFLEVESGRHILCGAGPGFDPADGRTDYAWGGAIYVKQTDGSLEDLAEELGLAAGDPIEPFASDKWEDNEATLRLLQSIIPPAN
jgi:hypothetical protein